MYKVLFFIPVLMALSSCERETQSFVFRIETRGFEMIMASGDKDGDFPEFNHKLSAYAVKFTGEQNSYWFDANRSSLEGFKFELPEGEYLMELKVPVASPYGQPDASFECEAVEIEINALTDTITVDITPTCALFLVHDAHQQLEHGACMIERFTYSDGLTRYFPLEYDTTSNLYYTYFSPDPYPSNPSAFLWFYDDNQAVTSGGLSTVDLDIGKIYRIKILD